MNRLPLPEPCDLVPGDLVRVNKEKVGDRYTTGRLPLGLWKKNARTLDELHEGGNCEHCGYVEDEDVCLVLARVESLNGVAGTATDSLMLLVGNRFGWNSAHWFEKIQDGGGRVQSPHAPPQTRDAIEDVRVCSLL